ncbi:MAG: serine/threonine protein kinase, partial [Deltaproteobacteria bacterium CG_4_10_14_0_2_um_filter_43_8]
MAKPKKKKSIPSFTSFDFEPGSVIAKKYRVLERIGSGWEGEVYRIRELNTHIDRAAKFFYPKRNVGNKAVVRYAKKLHKLRACPIVIHYYNQETILYKTLPVTVLISEFVEGELLSEFLKRQKGKRLNSFQALHLLHSLAAGMEQIHSLKEYHGDLHSDNIIVQRFGLGFQLKVIDFFHYGPANSRNIRGDVLDLVKIFHEALGGAKHYANQPGPVKQICCGLKKNLIFKKFKTAGQLRVFLENM